MHAWPGMDHMDHDHQENIPCCCLYSNALLVWLPVFKSHVNVTAIGAEWPPTMELIAINWWIGFQLLAENHSIESSWCCSHLDGSLNMCVVAQPVMYSFLCIKKLDKNWMKISLTISGDLQNPTGFDVWLSSRSNISLAVPIYSNNNQTNKRLSVRDDID